MANEIKRIDRIYKEFAILYDELSVYKTIDNLENMVAGMTGKEIPLLGELNGHIESAHNNLETYINNCSNKEKTPCIEEAFKNIDSAYEILEQLKGSIDKNAMLDMTNFINQSSDLISCVRAIAIINMINNGVIENEHIADAYELLNGIQDSTITTNVINKANVFNKESTSIKIEPPKTPPLMHDFVQECDCIRYYHGHEDIGDVVKKTERKSAKPKTGFKH